MSTIGDLVTIGVVGFVGYKLLVDKDTPTPSRQTTINEVKLPEVINPTPSKPMDTPIVTPDAPLVTDGMTVKELDIKSDLEEQTTDIKADLTLDINSINTIKNTEIMPDGTYVETELKASSIVTGPLNPIDFLPINFNSIGRTIDAIGGFFGGIADFFGGKSDDRLFSNLKT